MAEVGEELAVDFGVDESKLAAFVTMRDEEVAPLLAQLLEHRCAERTMARQAEARETALLAAKRIGAVVVWTHRVATLDVQAVLGDLLADAGTTYLLFDADWPDGGFQVSLPRNHLARIAKELGRRSDLVVAIDDRGLHFQWNRGRGGLNVLSQSIPPSEAMNVLFVGLPIPRVKPVVVPERRPQPRARVWVTELLGHIALG